MKPPTSEQEQVLIGCGTEPPFSGKYVHHKEDGTYTCAACGHALFSSNTKFDFGSGWPSFEEVMNDGSVTLRKDESRGMKRVEVRCAKCDGHLGHVFDDPPSSRLRRAGGPGSSGKRYCINSRALDFQKKKQNI